MLIRRIPLAQPIVVFIGRNPLPVSNAGNGPELPNLPQLLLAGQVIADVLVVDLAWPLMRWVAHQHHDGHRRAGTRTENLASFLAGAFPLSSLVSPQVEHIQVGELVGQAGAQARIGVAVDEGAVGHEGDDPLVPNPVTGPAKGQLVAVVQGFLETGLAAGRIGFLYPAGQMGGRPHWDFRRWRSFAQWNTAGCPQSP